MIVTKTIDLDMSRRLVNDTIRLHEGDVNGTALALNVTDNGTPFDLTGCTAKYDAVIGKYLAEADGVATISGSTITVPITPQMTVINGLLKIDVKIIKGGSILFFQTLEMNVQRRVIQGDEQIDLDGTTIGQKLELLDELFKNPPEKRLEVYDNDLDYADKNDTVYVHKVHSGTGSYVKGIVFVAGDVPPYQGCTQYRLRKSGSVEYRTGALNTTTDPYSYDWNYTATGNWKRLATLDDIPDIPEVVNPWKNKTYISHGDSITWQDGRAYGSGIHQGETARGYQTVLRELLELGTHTNKGVNGATLADRAGVSVSGVSTIKSIASYASYDLCTIAFGTNDFKQGVPLGTLGAATDTVFDTTTFYGAFREAVRYILTSSPTIRLVLMTPLQRNQHDYSVDTVNAVGLKLSDYVNAVKLIGKMYGLPVCDLYSNSGITELTLGAYTIDGLHPNDEGYKRMGEVLADTLTTGGNNDTADLSEFSKLAPLNPAQIADLPKGQVFATNDTVGVKTAAAGTAGDKQAPTIQYVDTAIAGKMDLIHKVNDTQNTPYGQIISQSANTDLYYYVKNNNNRATERQNRLLDATNYVNIIRKTTNPPLSSTYKYEKPTFWYNANSNKCWKLIAVTSNGSTTIDGVEHLYWKFTWEEFSKENAENKVDEITDDNKQSSTLFPTVGAVTAYLAARIAEISTIHFEVVQALPTQDIQTNVIYLVPKSTSETDNIYEEWIYVNNAWELIGSTEIDLSNYYTKTEIDAMIGNIETALSEV